MDVGWRRRAGAGPRTGARRHGCSTWPAAPATCAATWPRAGYRPSASTCRAGMLAHARTDAPLVQADALRPARPRRRPSTGPCAASPCATSWPCRRSSPSWPGSCAPAAGSPCSTWPSPPTRVAAGRPRRLLRPGRAPDRRPAVRRRRLPLPAPLGRLPAAPGRDARRPAPRRVRSPSSGACCAGGITQLITATRRRAT